MQIIPLVHKELEAEISILRKFLERVPVDKFDWKPHEKSMSVQTLAVHLAEIPGWIGLGLTTEELDFATTPYTPAIVSNTKELLAVLNKSWEESKAALNKAQEEDLLPKWTMRSGDQIFMVMTKYELIRHALGQIIHHRAQLGVYFRLLGIPVPGTYGPTADNQGF